jgi:Predicted sugar phosphatases of the HAD superfamily
MIADRYDAFLFDLDGVLYRGAEPIDGAAETLATLRSLGKGLAFLTNNSSRTPEAIAAHLTGMGIRAAPEEVETSALATATLLRGRGVASAYVLGEEGLRTALGRPASPSLTAAPPMPRRSWSAGTAGSITRSSPPRAS